MTIDQIMKLLDAGYTKEEINEFMDLQPQEPKPGTDPEPKPGTDPEPKPGTDLEPKPGTDPEPKPGTDPDEISKLTEQVKALTETMQEQFRNLAEEKKTGALDGDNILKNILEKGVI